MPTHADVPRIDVAIIEEDDTPNHPTGIKGGGELGLVGTAAAIANAVHDGAGVRLRMLPLALRAD